MCYGALCQYLFHGRGENYHNNNNNRIPKQVKAFTISNKTIVSLNYDVVEKSLLTFELSLTTK